MDDYYNYGTIKDEMLGLASYLGYSENEFLDKGDYQSYDYNKKIAIVVGNERFGINENWYNKPHKKVYIPMEGNQNSLNVGVALSILAYEAYMKRKWASKKLK